MRTSGLIVLAILLGGCSAWQVVGIVVLIIACGAAFIGLFFLAKWWLERKAAAWIRKAAVGLCELPPGSKGVLTFVPSPGVEHALRLDLDIEGPTHSFDLAVRIEMDGQTFFEREWHSGLDTGLGEDPAGLIDWTGSTIGSSSLANAQFGWHWSGIHHVMKLTPATPAPVTATVRLTPTGETRVLRARAMVTVGEPEM